MIKGILRYQLQIEGKVVTIDERKIRLLRGIKRYGSIKKASENCRIPYRTALKYIKSMEDELESKIVITKRGGLGGGGKTRLTTTGERILLEYQKLNYLIKKHKHVNELEGVVKKIDKSKRLMIIGVDNIEIEVPLDPKVKEGDEVIVFIDPEDIFITLDVHKSSVRNIIKAKIVGVKVKNGIVSLKLLANNLHFFADITKYSWDKLKLDLEDEVYIGFKALSTAVIKKI